MVSSKLRFTKLTFSLRLFSVSSSVTTLTNRSHRSELPRIALRFLSRFVLFVYLFCLFFFNCYWKQLKFSNRNTGLLSLPSLNGIASSCILCWFTIEKQITPTNKVIKKNSPFSCLDIKIWISHHYCCQFFLWIKISDTIRWHIQNYSTLHEHS